MERRHREAGRAPAKPRGNVPDLNFSFIRAAPVERRLGVGCTQWRQAAFRNWNFTDRFPVMNLKGGRSRRHPEQTDIFFMGQGGLLPTNLTVMVL